MARPRVDELPAPLRRRGPRVVTALEGVAVTSGLALSAIACCTWAVIQWLALGVTLLGGSGALTWLVHLEPLLLVAAATALVLAARFLTDLFSRVLDLLLASLMLLLAVFRVVWSISPFALWPLGPINWLFVHRQQVLLVAVLASTGIRLGRWAWRRSRVAPPDCCASARTPCLQATSTEMKGEQDVIVGGV